MWIVKPNDLIAVVWRRTSVVCAILSVVVVAYAATFAPTSAACLTLIYIMDAFYLLDIIFRARHAALKRRGIIVESRREIFRSYLRRDALLDMVALVPIELLSMAVDLANGTHGDVVLMKMGFCRLNRLVKVIRAFLVMSKNFYFLLHVAMIEYTYTAELRYRN